MAIPSGAGASVSYLALRHTDRLDTPGAKLWGGSDLWGPPLDLPIVGAAEDVDVVHESPDSGRLGTLMKEPFAKAQGESNGDRSRESNPDERWLGGF